MLIRESQNCGITECFCFGLGGMFKDQVVQVSCHGQGHIPLDQVTQSLIQSDFEHC